MRWLRNLINYLRHGNGPVQGCDAPVPTRSSRISGSGINFSIYKASGGFILEAYYYDNKKDESRHNLYIITDETNLGEELGRIVTLETLKR